MTNQEHTSCGIHWKYCRHHCLEPLPADSSSGYWTFNINKISLKLRNYSGVGLQKNFSRNWSWKKNFFPSRNWNRTIRKTLFSESIPLISSDNPNIHKYQAIATSRTLDLKFEIIQHFMTNRTICSTVPTILIPIRDAPVRSDWSDWVLSRDWVPGPTGSPLLINIE